MEHLAPLIAHLGGDRDWNALYHHQPGGIRQEQIKGNWKEYVEISGFTSDRHHTPYLNLELISVVPSLQMSNRMKPMMPDLRGTRVSILEVDGSGKSLTTGGA